VQKRHAATLHLYAFFMPAARSLPRCLYVKADNLLSRKVSSGWRLIVTVMPLLSLLAAALLVPYLIHALCHPERF
ncbi:hypothetical protein ABTQ03_19400, partial [Acinetobacter baumannii]